MDNDYPMLNIKIIVLGKIKESYWKEAESEYQKRLKPYAKIELVEIPEEPFRDSDDREKIKLKEADKILRIVSGQDKKNLPEGGLIVALHEAGKQFSSHQFASFLEEHSTRGETVTLIIGGPLGLHQSILQLAEVQLSLSQLTFPHQMVRTILLEQIYRAVTIQKGKQYHY